MSKTPIWLAAICAGLASCSSPATVAEPLQLVVPGDSVRLHEPDSLALAGAVAPVLLRTAEGMMILSEFPGSMIHSYGADGGYLGAFGRSGEGPGEFRRLTGIGLLPGDSLLAAVDAGRLRVILFRLADRSFVREFAIPEPILAGMGWATVGERQIVPLFLSPSAFVVWNAQDDGFVPWGDSIAGSTGASGMGRPVAVAVGDRVFTISPLDSMGQWHAATGELLERVPLPRTLRWGVPADAIAKIKEAQQRQEMQQVASTLLSGARFSGDIVGVLHVDLQATADQSRMGYRVDPSQMYLTLLSSTGGPGCADAIVPVPFPEYTWPAFTGDTIWFVDRSLAADGGAQTMVRGVVVLVEKCR